MKISALLSRCSAITALAVIAFAPLLSAKEAPSPFADNYTALSAVRSYESAAIKADQDRAKVLLGLNERLVAELTRAKSSALKSEKLSEAVAIDKRIKEANEATLALRNVLKATKPEGVTPTASVGASNGVGAAKLIGDFVASSGDKLTDTQKKVLGDIIAGKLVFTNDHRNPFAFDKDGNITFNNKVTTVALDGSGNLTIDSSVFALQNISADKVPYTWKGRASTGFIVPVNAPASPAKEVDPDNTIFGRRIK